VGVTARIALIVLALLLLVVAGAGIRHLRSQNARRGEVRETKQEIPAESVEQKLIPRERLLRIPEELQPKAREPWTSPRTGAAESGLEDPDSDLLEPSLTLESERIEAVTPSGDIESTKIDVGVTVSPDEESEQEFTISIEGELREDVEPKETERDSSIGVRIDVPFSAKPKGE